MKTAKIVYFVLRCLLWAIWLAAWANAARTEAGGALPLAAPIFAVSIVAAFLDLGPLGFFFFGDDKK